MGPFRVALAACALAAAPAVLLAQQTQPPNVRTVPPVKRAHPMPSAAYTQHHTNGHSGNRNANSYPVVIDASVINRFLATPTPGPKRTPAAAQRPKYGEQTFETHSTDDAR